MPKSDPVLRVSRPALCAEGGPFREVTINQREITSTKLTEDPHRALDDVVQTEEFRDGAKEDALRPEGKLAKAVGLC